MGSVPWSSTGAVDICEGTVIGAGGDKPTVTLEVEDGFTFFLRTTKPAAKAAACHIYQRVRVVLVPLEGS